MRNWAGVILLLCWPAAAALAAGPLELPPDDFEGAQYIDSAGCVYRRQGAVWAPHLDRDGALICGYPPSLPGRSLGSGSAAEDAALRLSITLAEGLQDSDLTEDPDHPLRREPAETPRASTGLVTELGSAVAAIPSLRAAAAGDAGRQGNLCALLGYDAATGSGGDGTLGICDVGEGILPPKTLTDAVSVAEMQVPGAPDQKDGADGARQTAAIQPPGSQAATEASASAAMRPTGSAANGKSKPHLAQSSGLEMVPAGARFVQIGRFAMPVDADAAIRRLAGLGYPVVRSTKPEAGSRLIMAGPLSDRQAVIAALNHLRESGYPKAFAR